MKIHLSTSDDLDAALFDNRRPGTEFVLQSGVHWTRGVWWHGANWERVLAPGCVVRPNDGPWEIRLHPDATRSLDGQPREGKDVWVMTHGEGAKWVGGFINGDYRNWMDSVVKAALRGYCCELEEMKFGGCRGGYANQVEAFPLSLIGAGASKLKDIKFIDCAPESYVSAVNFGHIGGTGTTTCEDVLVDIGDGNWFAFGVNERVRISNAKVNGKLRNLIYNDTRRTDGIEIEYVTVTGGVERVLSLVVKPGDDTFKGNVTMSGVETDVLADSAGDARIVEIWDQVGSGKTGAVLAFDCDFRSTATRVWAVSGATSSNAPLIVANSRLPEGALISGKGSILNCSNA